MLNESSSTEMLSVDDSSSQATGRADRSGVNGFEDLSEVPVMRSKSEGH